MSKNNKTQYISQIVETLLNWTTTLTYVPIIDLMAAGGSTPWEILVSTMLSARTKDNITANASRNLFKIANTASKTSKLSEQKIQELIYPVGFYKTKAKNLKKLSEIISTEFNCTVPNNVEDLIKLPGIGIKTASLVVIRAFGKDDICVDTHVFRISNLLNIVKTSNPNETRDALKKVVPKKYWQDINQVFVTLGQKICRPIKQECEKCPIKNLCPKQNK
jgi:endonuclease-3